ncbi:uncharacterized protein LOC114526551 [Dendronephthya gigantea]|uniref:uncharacterized protein LOC114526551 n=1 Tax=Dendronephthya gigantea TaxID=151771 RepID=UPI001069F113|nr:uncharacterized protein LOC114526551 [Dendronephthya gigantea]
MDEILQGIGGVGYILDDILVTGKDDTEHRQNLELTLQRLDDFGIKLKESKCSFMQDEVEYFAFVVNKEGIHPSPKKVEAMLKLEDPNNKKELQSWLGIVNYYRKFIPNMSTMVQPLTDLLANNVEWVWTEECANAYHKPLTLILGPKKGIPVLAASRIQRWAIQLSAYQFDIKYRSTEENGNADTLSRFPLAASGEVLDGVFFQEAELVNKMQVNGLPISATRMASATRNNKWLSGVTEYTRCGWPRSEVDSELQAYHRVREEISIEEDCLLRGVRVIVPECYREEILDELHRSHPGMVRMKALARLHVWWPNLDTNIERKVAACEPCREHLPNCPKAQANPWLWPQSP